MPGLVLLDRDGTLNADAGYTHSTTELRVFDDVYPFLRSLPINTRIAVITNQSGIGRGFYKLDDMHRFNNALNHTIFVNSHRRIHKFYYCPHTPDDHCLCRKPSPLLLNRALTDFQISKERTLLIGDADTDIIAANNASIASVLLRRNLSSRHSLSISPSLTVTSLSDPLLIQFASSTLNPTLR